MKKLISVLVVCCFVFSSGHLFGQESSKSKNDKKGGLSVGGYDQSRSSKAPTRSVVVKEEMEMPEKSMPAEKAMEEAVKPGAQAPAPAAEQAPAPAKPEKNMKENEKPNDKGKEGNAYGKNKSGVSGKDFGKTRSDAAKEKQKPKKQPKK